MVNNLFLFPPRSGGLENKYIYYCFCRPLLFRNNFLPLLLFPREFIARMLASLLFECTDINEIIQIVTHLGLSSYTARLIFPGQNSLTVSF